MKFYVYSNDYGNFLGSVKARSLSQCHQALERRGYIIDDLLIRTKPIDGELYMPEYERMRY